MDYDVQIKATVIKTLRVKAKNEDEAAKIAHERFTVTCNGSEEDYEQDTVSISEAKPEIVKKAVKRRGPR